MHPVIRILSVLTLLGFLSRASWMEMIPLAGLLIAVYRLSDVANLKRLVNMLWRLRYFFLVLVSVYGFSTPGQPLLHLPMIGGVTSAGIIEGSERVLALMMIVATVHWLIESTSRDALAAALYWLLTPLGCLGLRADRFVLRLVLTLERIEAMLEHTRGARPSTGDRESREGLMDRVARVFEEALARAEAERGIVVSLRMEVYPAPGQWIVWLVFQLKLLQIKLIGLVTDLDAMQVSSRRLPWRLTSRGIWTETSRNEWSSISRSAWPRRSLEKARSRKCRWLSWQ